MILSASMIFGGLQLLRLTDGKSDPEIVLREHELEKMKISLFCCLREGAVCHQLFSTLFSVLVYVCVRVSERAPPLFCLFFVMGLSESMM